MDKHLLRIDFHLVMIHSYWQIPASQQDPHPPERCFRRARELGENVSDHINFQMDVCTQFSSQSALVLKFTQRPFLHVLLQYDPPPRHGFYTVNGGSSSGTGKDE